jgi:hypothetical protein
MSELRVLMLRGLPNLKELRSLGDCTAVEVLQISGCKQLQQVEGFRWSGPLRQLHIIDCDQLEAVQHLEAFPKLEQLQIGGCGRLKELDGLEKLAALQQLHLASGHDLLKGVKSLPALRQLVLDGCENLQVNLFAGQVHNALFSCPSHAAAASMLRPVSIAPADLLTIHLEQLEAADVMLYLSLSHGVRVL